MTTATTYGRRARRYWETYLPATTETVDDPETFFQDLGQQVLDQIAAAMTAYQPPPGVTDQAELSAHRQGAWRAAEEEAMTDLVLLPPESGRENARMESVPLPGWEDVAPAAEG